MVSDKKVWAHIAVINEELGIVQNDIKWIKWFVAVNLVMWSGLVVKLLLG